MGVDVISSQIIRLSYPWIGIPLEFLRIRNRPSFPFLMAHATRFIFVNNIVAVSSFANYFHVVVVVIRVIISYVYYESCQVQYYDYDMIMI